MRANVKLNQLAACVLLATTLLFAATPGEALGAGMAGGSPGGFGGHAGGFAGHPGFHGHAGTAVPPRFDGPSGFVGRPGFYRDHRGRGFVFAGPAFYWWPSYPYDGAPAGYWYYCPSVDLFYPYVESCAEPWVEVPPE